mmetsp:Transcript_17570/g.45257  ORF Transcript_17570/g.45257 Transcript_17570/m.45257 type:complete len:260 (-) Transcript_17570:554-1333(-)
MSFSTALASAVLLLAACSSALAADRASCSLACRLAAASFSSWARAFSFSAASWASSTAELCISEILPNLSASSVFTPMLPRGSKFLVCMSSCSSMVFTTPISFADMFAMDDAFSRPTLAICCAASAFASAWAASLMSLFAFSTSCVFFLVSAITLAFLVLSLLSTSPNSSAFFVRFEARSISVLASLMAAFSEPISFSAVLFMANSAVEMSFDFSSMALALASMSWALPSWALARAMVAFALLNICCAIVLTPAASLLA